MRSTVRVLEGAIGREKLESSGWSVLPPPEAQQFLFDFISFFKVEERPFKKKNTQNFLLLFFAPSNMPINQLLSVWRQQMEVESCRRSLRSGGGAGATATHVSRPESQTSQLGHARRGSPATEVTSFQPGSLERRRKRKRRGGVGEGRGAVI